jgi:hypothetical protein
MLYPYLVYPIPIEIMQYHHGLLRLSLRVTILHGPKNDQSLCNNVMGVLSLRIGLMEYVLSCTNNIQSIFCLVQNVHTLYMDLSNLVFIQIKFKLFRSKYLYIHSFLMPMAISMEVKLIYKNGAWKIHGCHTHSTKCV